MRLARGERQEMVQMLSAEGMSTRAIAPIVGASVGQVHADKQVFRTEHVEAAPVQGMDGKSYARPEPAEAPKPKRRPLTDQSSEAGC
jgi:transposase